MTNNNNKLVLSFITRLKILFFTLIGRLIFNGSDTTTTTTKRLFYNLVNIKSPAPATKLINTTPVSTSDVHINPSRNLWFRLFVPGPADNRHLPLILHFHGGGFSTFGPDSKVCDDICSLIAAQTPAIVASINYRLAPEHRYPSQYEDGFDTLKFISSQNDVVLPANANLSKCFVLGDSAGANIAHHVIIRARKNPREVKNLNIVGFVSVQPFFGGEERTESEMGLRNAPMIDVKMTDWMWRSFLPEGADRDHYAANVLKSKDEIKNVDFPRTLVFVGGCDPLQDWQRRYVEWMKKGGKEVELIEYPNAFHAFYTLPELPECQLFIENMGDFIRNKCLVDGNTSA